MSLLSRLFGGGHDSVVSNDLKRLNNIKSGLGDQAVNYVRTGADATVLSSLSVLCKTNELEVGQTYLKQDSPAQARRELFAQAEPYDLDVMQRYAEALCAAGNAPSVKTVGTDAAPKAVRVFFSEAFLGVAYESNTWPRKAKPLSGRGLTVERAVEMARRLGGNPIDFFDVVYAREDAGYGMNGDLYRQAAPILTMAERHAAALMTAAARLPAQSRTVLLGDLAQWGAARSGEVAEFLVAQAGDGAKSVREAAVSALASASPEVIEPIAIRLLQQGDANQRAGMVDLLKKLGSTGAMEALKAHREKEKTSRIAAAIDTALSLVEQRTSPSADTDDASGYTAIGGRRIDVPPFRPLAQGEVPKFGDADRNALRAIIASENARFRKQWEESRRRGHNFNLHKIPERLADEAVDFFNSDTPRLKERNELAAFLGWGSGLPWVRDALARLPDARAFTLARSLRGGGATRNLMYGAGSERLMAYLNSPAGDLRTLERLDIEAAVAFEHGAWTNRQTRQMQRGDWLRSLIRDGYSFEVTTVANLPKNTVWPYLAENLDVFDEAFGLKPQGEVSLDRASAVRMLAMMPATPARYFAPLLEVATGESKAGRAEARAMLGSAPEVEARLVALLDDSRQAIRAGAAEWLSVRRDGSAVKALHGRLKKEKSEVARAAILTALKRLGEDLSNILGPSALIAEAEKGLKSAKFDKLGWLALSNLTGIRFRDGTGVPNDVLRWWVFSAFRLKQPGGNALFQIYLDQLDPKDAETFSTWILDSWIGYDTARPTDAEANAHAKAHASNRFQSMLRWIKDYTEERAFAELRREFMSQYLNSGADTKGVLALAARASSAVAADRVRAYLKNHGSRTSQASALLEVLAGIGDPVTLQVVIAAATRLKQKGVQRFAGELITKVAEARDWTLDELADRTIPSAGFDDDGVLTLPCGEGDDAKVYEARVTADLSVTLRNPAGKDVSSLPSGQDEASAASKKQLATTKKELKQIVAMQSARLYEALCAERSWSADDWTRHFHAHPVMRRLVERVVWLGIDADGKVTGAFRPTAEGDFTDAGDNAVEVTRFAQVRVAHGALLDDAQGKAWEQHLADYEVKPLFAQFGRSLLRVAPEDARKTEIEDRKGWVTDAFTIRGAAAKLGYERGPALDGGFFNEYRKSFMSAGLAAVVEFSGNSLPEQNVPAALKSLKFEKAAGPGRYGGAVKLSEVPPVLLSECWNDYRAMAAKGAYDPNWETKSPW
jgi:hypothetical protein